MEKLMDEFKLEHFAKDHPGKTFPAIEALGAAPSTAVRDEIATRFGLDPHTQPLSLLETVQGHSIAVQGANADSPDFNLGAVLKQLGLLETNSVYLNWDRFELLSRMSLADLMNVFEYLWYPSADDLEIIAEDLSWILSVAHYGTVFYVRLPEPQQN
jgi:hypothetical protein